MLEILTLLIAQFNLPIVLLELSQNELTSKKLNKKSQDKLGVRSPKLSKALIALGVPQNYVSILLSAGKTEKSQVLGNRQAALEQGNSVHWSSCQATDPRAEGYNIDSTLVKVSQEAAFCGLTWWLWVVGEPMSVNGEGFKARAKVRFVVNRNKTVGYYVDKIYGNPNLLDLNDLKNWANGLPILEECSENDPKVLCSGVVPSSRYGYQDSELYGIRWFKEKKPKSLLLQAYMARRKECGAYVYGLENKRYNPQNGGFTNAVPDIVRRLPRPKPHWTSTLVHDYIRNFFQCSGKEILEYKPCYFLPNREGVVYQFKKDNFQWTVNYYFNSRRELEFCSIIDLPEMGNQFPYGVFAPEPEKKEEEEEKEDLLDIVDLVDIVDIVDPNNTQVKELDYDDIEDIDF